MKSYSSKELLQIVKDDGWYEINQEGSHLQLKHPTKKGKVTIPHPRKDFPIRTVKNILRQAGLEI
ncbi:MAG: addiction module toxin, HicA family [Pelosinus sp.]|nr:addiction module toxin, HicA family [Pelosinus sp.]